jgi:hypothetical protein
MFYGKSPFPAALDQFHAAIQRESAKRMRQEFGVAAVLSAAVLAISAAARRRVEIGSAEPLSRGPVHLNRSVAARFS